MLSRRAQKELPQSPFNKMWDMIRDPWSKHTNPEGSVDLGVAENKLMQAELKHFLETSITLHDSAISYQDGPTGSPRLRRAIASFLTRSLSTHRPLSASHIVVTNGVSSALEHAAWALADDHEAFLLGRPYYGKITLHQRPRVRTVPVTFGATDPLSLAAIPCYERALLAARKRGQPVKGLLLCSPHNPLGRCYARGVLVALLAFCAKYSLHLVSDEVYALSVWGADSSSSPTSSTPPFTSVLAIDCTHLIDPRLVHVLWGVSKDFGANGWRLGCFVSPANEDLRVALGKVAIYSYASSLADCVVAQTLEDTAFTEAYLKESRRRLREAYGFATRVLRGYGVAVRGEGEVQAALFVWVDLGGAWRSRRRRGLRRNGSCVDGTRNGVGGVRGDDEDESVVGQIKEALRVQKVYLAWGGDFDAESEDWWRIVFSHPREYLLEGLRRVDRALGGEGGGGGIEGEMEKEMEHEADGGKGVGMGGAVREVDPDMGQEIDTGMGTKEELERKCNGVGHGVNGVNGLGGTDGDGIRVVD